jgi:hypothetical protein
MSKWKQEPLKVNFPPFWGGVRPYIAPLYTVKACSFINSLCYNNIFLLITFEEDIFVHTSHAGKSVHT